MKADLAQRLLEDDKLAKAVCEVFLIAIKRCLEGNKEAYKILEPIKVDDILPRFQQWLQSIMIEDAVANMFEGRRATQPVNGFVSGGYSTANPDKKSLPNPERIISKEDQRRLIDLIK